MVNTKKLLGRLRINNSDASALCDEAVTISATIYITSRLDKSRAEVTISHFHHMPG